MGCPHLKEVAMVYCEAFPLKKLLRADRTVLAGPCICGDFRQCAFYCACTKQTNDPETNDDSQIET